MPKLKFAKDIEDSEERVDMVAAARAKFKNPNLTLEEVGYFEDATDPNNIRRQVKDISDFVGGTKFFTPLLTAAEGALPAVAGALTGAGALAVAAPTTGPGALLAGVGGAVGGGVAAAVAQDQILKRFAPGTKEYLELARQVNPKLALLGDVSSGFGVATPLIRGLRPMLAKALGKKAADVTGKEIAAYVGSNAAVGGGIDAAQQMLENESINPANLDPLRLGASALGGALQIKPTVVGRLAHDVGSKVGQAVRGRVVNPDAPVTDPVIDLAQLNDTPVQDVAALDRTQLMALNRWLETNPNATPDALSTHLLNEYGAIVPIDPDSNGGWQTAKEAIQRRIGALAGSDLGERGVRAAELYKAKAAGAKEESVAAAPWEKAIWAEDSKAPLSEVQWRQLGEGVPLAEVRAAATPDVTATAQEMNAKLRAAEQTRMDARGVKVADVILGADAANEAIPVDATKTEFDSGAAVAPEDTMLPPVLRREGDDVLRTDDVLGIPKPRAAPKAVIPAGGPALPPTPEGTAAIQKQLELTADPNSSKAITLISAGDPLPAVPSILRVHATPHGTEISNPNKVSLEGVELASTGVIHAPEPLGQGALVPESDMAVTTEVDGVPNVLSELVTSETLDAALTGQQVAAKGKGVQRIVPAEQMIQERLDTKGVEDGISAPTTDGTDTWMYSGIPPHIVKQAFQGAWDVLDFLPRHLFFNRIKPNFERIKDIDPQKGLALGEADKRRTGIVNRYINQDTLSIDNAKKGLTAAEQVRMDAYLWDIDDIGVSTVRPSVREQNAINLLRGMRAAQLGRPLPYVDGTRPITSDATSIPQVMTKRVMEVLRSGSANNASPKLRHAFNNLRDEYIAYHMARQRSSLDAAQRDFDVLQGGMTRVSPLDGPKYNALRRAEGIGIPRAWRENVFTALTRDAIRHAHDAAFFQTVQQNPTLAKWLGVTDDGRGNAYVPDPGESAGNKEVLRAWLDSINMHRVYNPSALNDVMGLIGSVKLSSGTALRDLTQTPFIAMEAMGAPKDVMGVLEGSMNTFRNWGSAQRAGAANRRNAAMLERINEGILTGGVARVKDLLGKYSGRQLADVTSRQWLFEFGVALNDIHSTTPEYRKWLEKMELEEGWRTATVPELGEMVGRRLVDRGQSNYDGHTLPPYLLQGEGNNLPLFFGGLARWSVSRANTWDKKVWQPLRDGDFKPLLMSMFGAALSATALAEINEQLGLRKAAFWTPKEWARAMDKETGYTALANLNTTSTTGMLGSVLYYGASLVSDEKPQIPLVNLGVETGKMVQHRIAHLINAVQDGADFGTAVADTTKAIADSTFQVLGMYKSAFNAAKNSREEHMYRRQMGVLNAGARAPRDEVGVARRLQRAETPEEAMALVPELQRMIEGGGAIPESRSVLRPFGREMGKPVTFYDWMARNKVPGADTIMAEDIAAEGNRIQTQVPALETSKALGMGAREEKFAEDERRGKEILRGARVQQGP